MQVLTTDELNKILVAEGIAPITYVQEDCDICNPIEELTAELAIEELLEVSNV